MEVLMNDFFGWVLVVILAYFGIKLALKMMQNIFILWLINYTEIDRQELRKFVADRNFTGLFEELIRRVLEQQKVLGWQQLRVFEKMIAKLPADSDAETRETFGQMRLLIRESIDSHQLDTDKKVIRSLPELLKLSTKDTMFKEESVEINKITNRLKINNWILDAAFHLFTRRSPLAHK
jgi:hypothetical protein